MDWDILPQKKPQLAKPTKGFHHETHRYVQYTSLWYVEFTWNVDSCDHNTAAVITNHTQSCTNDTFCPPENHSRSPATAGDTAGDHRTGYRSQYWAVMLKKSVLVRSAEWQCNVYTHAHTYNCLTALCPELPELWTSLPILAVLQLPSYALPSLSLLLALYSWHYLFMIYVKHCGNAEY